MVFGRIRTRRVAVRVTSVASEQNRLGEVRIRPNLLQTRTVLHRAIISIQGGNFVFRETRPLFVHLEGMKSACPAVQLGFHGEMDVRG